MPFSNKLSKTLSRLDRHFVLVMALLIFILFAACGLWWHPGLSDGGRQMPGVWGRWQHMWNHLCDLCWSSTWTYWLYVFICLLMNHHLTTIVKGWKSSICIRFPAYQEVVVIPQGAVHVIIKESVISRNYLGKHHYQNLFLYSCISNTSA